MVKLNFSSDSVVRSREVHPHRLVTPRVAYGRPSAILQSCPDVARRGRARGPPPLALVDMQLPEAPPPLAPLWDRVLRARALPPDLDVQLLYVAIRDRLVHPEWEVRLHALRVLGDLLPLSGNALDFPFDQVVDNLGHSSPNVRKGALDALKVFCHHCEEPECAARAILDKCSYRNIRPHSANMDSKANVITGLILSVPSVLGILKKRNVSLDTFPIFRALGDKLFDPVHKDIALRSMLKLRRVFGPREYLKSFSLLDHQTQDKFRIMCELYDEDSLDVHYGPRFNSIRGHNNSHLLRINHAINSVDSTPVRLSTDSSSEESYFVRRDDRAHSGYAKVIIETEIKFDSDTAITMTVLEGNETETDSDKNLGSEEDCDSSDRNMLKYSDCESEDTDVVVSQKRVRFGGETFKIRTPDSENITSDNITSEDDTKLQVTSEEIAKFAPIKDQSDRLLGPIVSDKIEEIKSNYTEEVVNETKNRKSGIPLPVIQTKIRIQQKTVTEIVKPSKNVKQKSKSLNELYDYFRTKRDDVSGKAPESSGFALTISEIRPTEKIPSPVEPHREVEVLHNLQRSPTLSPRRQKAYLQLEKDGFVLNVLATTPPPEDHDLLSPRTSLQSHYEWENFDIVPKHVVEQLHNTNNWIFAVKAADVLHSALLDPANVEKIEPAAKSLVLHMWALSDAVLAARAPAEGAVCAVIRTATPDCTRDLLPTLVTRLASDPPPAALPHALLQRLALHNLIDLIFDPGVFVGSNDWERLQSQLRATLCIARSAGPAAVLSAVRRRLSGSGAETFCQKLRESLNRPVENVKTQHIPRSSQLPVPVRRRARSTPPASIPALPRKLRPLPDSAPLLGGAGYKSLQSKRLSPIPLSDRDSSATTVIEVDKKSERNEAQLKADDIDKRSTERERVVSLEENDELPKISSPVVTPTPPPAAPRSPSIRVEDYSVSEPTEEPEVRCLSIDPESPNQCRKSPDSNVRDVESIGSSPRRSPSADRSERSTPARPCERDVRVALGECSAASRLEDWEAVVNALCEAERLALDPTARAPAAAWKAAARAAIPHVRSLRSRVARAAASCVGALWERRGRALETELEEAVSALLDRCADVNRFLRAEAGAALSRVAVGGGGARAVCALCRRGAGHRAGPVRAAAAAALAERVRAEGASRILTLPAEPRALLLRASAELLGDASAEARAHGRRLCLALAEDDRFRPMLKEAMPPARYRAVEKNVDKLRSR